MSTKGKSSRSSQDNKSLPQSFIGNMFTTGSHIQRYSERHHRHNEILFDKELFVKSNFRFIMKKDVDQKKYMEQFDAPIIWDDVKYVECTVSEDNNCPICLDSVKVPRVGCCGHIYCYVCIMACFQHGNGYKCKCSICGETITANSLRVAYLKQRPKPLQIRDSISFLLMERTISTLCPIPSGSSLRSTINSYHIPYASDYDARFCKILLEDEDYNEMVAIQDQKDFLEQKDSMLAIGETMYMPIVSAIEESICVFPSVQVAIEERKARLDKQNKRKNSNQLNEHSSTSTKLNPTAPEFILASKSSKERSYNDYTQTIQPYSESIYLEDSNTSNKIENIIYYYQESKGRHYVIHPFIMKGLLYDYKTYDHLPRTLRSTIRDMESVFITPETRHKYVPLKQFPLYTEVYYIEIEVSRLLSSEAFHMLQPEIKQRDQQRKKRLRIQKRRESQMQREEDKLYIPQVTPIATTEITDLNSLHDYVHQWPSLSVYNEQDSKNQTELASTSISESEKVEEFESTKTQILSSPQTSTSMLTSGNQQIDRNQWSFRTIMKDGYFPDLGDIQTTEKKQKKTVWGTPAVPSSNISNTSGNQEITLFGVSLSSVQAKPKKNKKNKKNKK